MKRSPPASAKAKSRRSAPRTSVPKITESRNEPLARLVTPIDSFVRSTNVERDMANAETLGTYIADASVLDTIHRVVASITKGGKAFSVTGPYGSGKSTLGVFLNGLVAPSASADWKYAYRLLKNTAPSTAEELVNGRRELGAHKSGFVRCFVVSGREPVVMTVVRALEKGVKERFGKRYSKKDFASASKLRRVCDELRKTNKLSLSGTSYAGVVMEIVRDLCSKAPVIILIDEFGKNLEYFAESKTSDGDLFLLQSMAEAGAGRKGMALFIVTMQHMAFEEYGASTSAAHRREWAKVQGRFDDIPFSNSPEQTRLLIAKSLQANQGTQAQKEIRKWANDHITEIVRLNLDGLGRDIIASCYPLHPLALLLLPELCFRYGQYERTLMTFVAGGARNTVPSFIDNATWAQGRLPSMDIEDLYDYFVSNHQTMSSASTANVTRLMEITSIIRDSHGLTKNAVKLLKTIGVLNLISMSGNLRASKSMLQYAVGTSPIDAIQELEDKSLITYRPHADEYRIWRGTDVDIQAMIEILSRHHSKASLADMLTVVLPREPTLASRHGIKTGTMRMFEQRFVASDKRTVDVSNQDYDGVVIYMTEHKGALPKIAVGSRPVVLVRPSGNLDKIRGVVLETLAMKGMLETDAKVKNDWVARRELLERVDHNVSMIEAKIDQAYKKGSEWWLLWGSSQHRLSGYGGMAVSDAADKAYPGTPNVHNEMINRTKLSTQASRARLALVNAMINGHSKESMGITGWGPERAMYEALIKKTGLHAQAKKSWRIAVPGSDIRLAWDSVMDFILRAQQHRVNVGEVYASLQAPPIGAKPGIAPILLIASLIIKNGDVAMYEHGTYRPSITPEILERLLKNPVHFEIKNFSSSAKHHAHVIRKTGKELNIKNPSLLAIVSLLVNTASKFPNYVKSTKKLRKQDRAVLDSILTATEPDTLLFVTLPNALNIKFSASASSDKLTSRFSSMLHKSMLTLEEFYPNLLCTLQKNIFAATRTKDRKEISSLASVLLEKTAVEPRMRKFLSAVAAVTLDDVDWEEYVAMSLTDKPMSEWDDDDLKMFENNLSELSAKFIRLVALNFDKTSKFVNSASPRYRIAITSQSGAENMTVVAIDKKREDGAIAVMQKIKNELSKKQLEDPHFITALIVSLLKKYHNM